MFSVIVPIYNMERYLSECIDSILAQDFEDFEVLLIDDGSFDKSGSICDEYAKRDKRVRVFHKPNGGLSDARNYGLKRAKNEFILFCDPDDYWSKQLLARLSQHVVENDLVIFNFCYKFRNATMRNHIHDFGQTLSVGIIGDYGIYGYAPMKVYRRSIIEKYQLSFDKTTSVEDLMFATQYSKFARKYKILDCPLYYYRQRKCSITNIKTSEWQSTSLKAYIALYNASEDEAEKRILANLCIKALYKYKSVIKDAAALDDYNHFVQSLSNQYPMTAKEKILTVMYKYTPWMRALIQSIKDLFLWRYP